LTRKNVIRYIETGGYRTERGFTYLKKIAIQCDFDGTITGAEVSIMLLEKFAGGDWKKYDDDFYQGRMSVKECTKRCFALVKADERTMTDFVLADSHVKIRDGFLEFHDYCKQKGFPLYIVSNGLVFYINAVLNKLGVSGIEVIAARNRFSPDGMTVEFPGQDGEESDTDFKELFTRQLQNKGYDVVCIGDSVSDMPAARQASYIFATNALPEHCRKENISFIPFKTFFDVIRGLESLA
jgi:2-hydroxy-3-keto-5-methylthiopentenyl-1-phosphate phosphatase